MNKTPLYERHIAAGAKMIDFDGWILPVQYTNVIEEHRTTRERAALFDICHMGEIDVEGPQALELLQRVMSRNLAGQRIGQMKLSLILNERGGIIDDLTVYRLAEDHYMVVTNASTKDKDLAWLLRVKEDLKLNRVDLKDVTEITAKLDLQGPRAQLLLQGVTADDLAPLKFYESMQTRVLALPALVSRSGYTGEDGFEIYVAENKVGLLWDGLLDAGKAYGLCPSGLGARDTLRLEAGMMLYGNEMCEEVSPYEVVYGWLADLGKEFIGREALLAQKRRGPDRKLVGFQMQDRGIARHGYKVVGTEKAGEIGMVTSGTFTHAEQGDRPCLCTGRLPGARH